MPWRSNPPSKMSHLDVLHDHHYSQTLDVNFLFILSSNLGNRSGSWQAGNGVWMFSVPLFLRLYQALSAWSGKYGNQVTRPGWMFL